MKDRYVHGLLEVCERLHMSNTGSSDGLNHVTETQLLDWLTRRLDNWDWNSNATWNAYDESVLQLLRVTISETMQKRDRIGKLLG